MSQEKLGANGSIKRTENRQKVVAEGDFLESLLADLLEKVLRGVLRISDEALKQVQSCLLEEPKEKSFGDISSPCALKLASFLKRPPRQIAQEMVSSLNAEISGGELKNLIEKIDIAGAGFINFYLSKEYFYSHLKEIHNSKDFFSFPEKESQSLLIEFVSANPTGPLSVAHGRQAAVGDVLASILQFLGYKVTREYYLNDEGNQINILGKSIALRLKELQGEKIDFPEDHYQGDYIIDLAKELLEAQQRQNTGRGRPCACPITSEDCREHGVRRILEIIRKELEDFGVRFDSWYSQAVLQKSGKIERVIADLREKGFVYDQEGAVWFSSTKFGDDKDRVIIKSDGSYTYLAPDIAYHQDKFRRGFNRLINLWGPDHHGYIPRMKAAVEALGQSRDSLNVIIVQLASLFREGKAVSMSTRKGEYVTLRQVMDEVGSDAARFFFLMRRTDSHLDFDLELAKKQSAQNPVYYVQYSYARICSILANSNAGLETVKEADLSLLKEMEEIALLKVLHGFKQSLRIVEVQLDPYNLTVYLQELAESFHRFYDKHRVLVEDVKLRDARLSLILGCKEVLASGFRLLGIKAPEKM